MGSFAVLLTLTAGASTEDAPVVLVLRPAAEVQGVTAQDVADELDLAIGDLGIRVTLGDPVPAGALEAQIDAATQAGRSARALAVVWYEGTASGLRAQLIDLRAGRAVVQQIDLGEAAGERAARTLALKLRHLLGVTLVDRTPQSPVVRALVEPILPPAPPPRLQASLDWALTPGPSGIRHGPGGSLVLRVYPRYEASLRFAYLFGAETTSATGSATTDDAAVSLELQRVFLRGAIDLRAGLLAGAHLYSSTGTTVDGRSGSGSGLQGAIGARVGWRIHVVRALAVEASFAAGWLFERRRFLLRGAEAFDSGSLGLEFRLGLVVPGD